MSTIRFAQSTSVAQLYLSTHGTRQLAFLLPRGAKSLAQPPDLAAAWNSAPQGCLLMLQSALETPAQPAFADAAWRMLNQPGQQTTCLAWVERPNAPSGELAASLLALRPSDNEWRSDRAMAFDFGGLLVMIGGGCSFTLDAAAETLHVAQPGPGQCALVTTSGRRYPLSNLALNLGGEAPGSLRFGITLAHDAIRDDFDQLEIGLRAFVKDCTLSTGDDQFFLLPLRYPLLSTADPDWNYFKGDLTLHACLDPLAPLDGAHSYFGFVDPANGTKPKELPSAYRTNLGYTVHLTPKDSSSRLVFATQPASSLLDSERYYLTPAGDFDLSVPLYDPQAAPPAADNLLCGVSGVEYIALSVRGTDNQPAGIMRFHPGQPAFAARYTPGSEASAGEEVSLSDTATTSWAYVYGAASSLTYFAQPEQATLFQPQASGSVLLAYLPVPVANLAASSQTEARFPLMPHGAPRSATVWQTTAADRERVRAELRHEAQARDLSPLELRANAAMLTSLDRALRGGRITLADYRQVELQFLSPLRRAQIHLVGEPIGAGIGTLAEGDDVSGTTPQGLLASYSEDYAILRSLLLARGTDDADLKLSDLEATAPLRAALQSNQLFMVLSNPEALKSAIDEHSYFPNNDLNIQNWIFDLDPVGWKQSKTVLIFKFAEKTLLELLADTGTWAFPHEFNTEPARTQSELSALFDAALATASDEADPKERENYRNLVRALTVPGWSGILALNVPLPDGIPDSLSALKAGLKGNILVGQYLGIESTPIRRDNGNLSAAQSSLFGLIDYKAAPGAPSADDYDFEVLTLRVLFENSQIKGFDSDLALTLNRLFDETSELQGSEDGRNSVLLKGSAEDHDGQTIYSFSFAGSNRFLLAESHVLSDVEIIKAQLSSDPPAGQDKLSSRFSLWGRLNFRAIEKFDLLSFGADDPEIPDEQFLSFANLAVQMLYKQGNEEEREFIFNPRNMVFDLDRSRVRAASLYARFPLKLTGLLYSQGEGDKGVNEFGYMPVKSPLGSAKIERGAWYALTFDVDLGGLGALAGNGALVASIMTAWSPADDTIFVGLRLPGSAGGKREIPIQGVLKLVFKGIEFVVGATDGQTSYVLKLKNIVLKLLVLSLPPSGRIDIMIFGDPNGTPDQRTVGWYAAYAKGPTPEPPLVPAPAKK